MKKKLVAMFLAIVMIASVVVMPASAATTSTGSYVQVTIKARSYSSAFTAYDTEKEADKHPITLQLKENEFPVVAKIVGKNGNSDTFTFNTYGTKKVKVSDQNAGAHIFAFLFTFGLSTPSVLLDDTARYATINIVKPTATPPASSSNNSTSTTPAPAGNKSTSNTSTSTDNKSATETLTIDETLDKLLDELELPFVRPEYTPYGKELKAFLTGEWDGTWRRDEAGNDYAGYIASRKVFNRTYSWSGTSLYTGKTIEKKVNVDYIGYKQIIPAPTSTQDFSFAVSYVNGEIEEWSLLEQRNAWKLNLSGEHVDKIYPIGTKGSESRGLVYTLDANGQQHMYSLLSGGRVQKLT